MYIMRVMLCLFSALSRRVGALQISILIIITIIWKSRLLVCCAEHRSPDLAKITEAATNSSQCREAEDGEVNELSKQQVLVQYLKVRLTAGSGAVPQGKANSRFWCSTSR